MKKIGILTYHRSINYGAVMQAYSLSERLSKDFPDYTVEIIDYMSEVADRIYHPSFWRFLKLASTKKELRGKAVLIKQAFIFLRKQLTGRRDYGLNQIFEDQLKHLRLSDNYIVSDDENILFEQIKGKYDAVVVGSDAVFNWQIRQFPSPYFLAGDIGALKLSYAASSYGQEYTTINNYQKNYLSNAWRTFSYLGVRDFATEEFIRFVDSSFAPNHNCDPTVFLELDSIPVEDSEIEALFIGKGIDLTKPIVGIMAQDWLGKLIREILGEKYQFVAIFKDNPYADFYLQNLSPFQWSKVFRYFNITFTHFFHGNLLSLRNETPTIVIENRTPYNATHNSKIRDLMLRMDLSDFCYYRDEVDSDEQKMGIVSAVEDRINNSHEYKKRIREGLEKESLYYNSFYYALKSALDDDAQRT